MNGLANALRSAADGFGYTVAPEAYGAARRRTTEGRVSNGLSNGLNMSQAADIAFLEGDMSLGMGLQDRHLADKRNGLAMVSQGQAIAANKQNMARQSTLFQQGQKDRALQKQQQLEAQKREEAARSLMGGYQKTLEMMALPLAERATFHAANGGQGAVPTNDEMQRELAQARTIMAQLGIDVPNIPQEELPPRMTAYQRAQIAATNARLALDRDRFEAEEARQNPPAALNFAPYNGPPRANDFWEIVEPNGFAGADYSGARVYQTQAVDGMGLLDDNLPDDQGRPRAADEYSTYNNRASGKNDADRLQEIQEGAQTITNTGNVRLDAMESLLDQGVATGPLSGARLVASRIIPGVDGVTLDETAAGKLAQFRRLSQDYALEVGERMKGAFSDADRAFVQEALNANMRPEEARQVINSIRAVNDRIELHADAASDWAARYGGLSRQDSQGRDFDTAWRQYQQANPVFSRQQIPGTVGEGVGVPSGARTGIDNETGRPVYQDRETGQIFFSDTGEPAQ